MRIHVFAMTLALMASGALLAGCGGGNGGDPPLPTECDNDEFEATFVLDHLSIPDENVGFNLDGEDTYCESGCINDGENGVDNRLGAVLDGLSDSLGEDFNANEELEVQIEEGGLLILFRLLNICNFNADGDVTLLGYMGIDTDDPEDPTDNFSGTEPFDVDIRSLEGAGTDPMNTMISFPSGEISRREFSAGPAVFNLDIPMQDSTLGLSIRETQVRFNFQPEPSDTGGSYLNGNIINGLLGGFVLVEDLADALQEFADDSSWSRIWPTRCRSSPTSWATSIR
ncbi:MAG: hypothetical protein JRG91_05570 [Deltaproteobacteria bacterium]|nr:hypothetical protein [Deltaproteobacteria bacterium]